VGRSSVCDILLTDHTVSRLHARLVCRDARWILEDLGSTNGSYINGDLVGRCELRPGDRLSLGNALLRVD
jgi:pSer/pThr/pTyr-binding forkhead associated (FHA) protein